VLADADVAAIADLAILAMCDVVEMHDGARARTTRAYDVDIARRTIAREVLVPHHACGTCRDAQHTPALRALREAADWHRALAREDAKDAPGLETLHTRLTSLVGERHGTFAALSRTTPGVRHEVWKFFRARAADPRRSVLANAHAALAIRRSHYRNRSVAHVSEGLDFDDARVADSLALVEGLERLFAMSYCGTGRIVEERYSRLGDDAFDPREFPLFAGWQYEQPGVDVQPFDPERVVRWLPAVDLASGRPVFVPFDLVYDDGAASAIYRANSNGAACHGSARQALANAICEVVERDALMVAWLHRLSMPRLAPEGLPSDPWDLRATFGELDFQLEHVDLTVDTGIPVWLAVLRDRRDPRLFLLDMVAGFDRDQRLRKLYRELTQFAWPYLADRTHFVTARTTDPDPDNVRTFVDHLAFYQSPQRNREAAFLTASPQESAPLDAQPAPPTARDELDALLARLVAGGFRVLAVDCTAPMLAALGLSAVKVLIPGLVPLNADHRLRSLGGERLARLPERLGRVAPGTGGAGLNPWPHPFW
jgi:ribosomal protein S12 methylthiotransferase accessory factor